LSSGNIWYEIVKNIWLFLSMLQLYLGIITPFVFIYSLTQCIKHAVAGEELKEYRKLFFLSGICLLLLIAPYICSYIL
jgi:hypothetical protein